MTNPIVCTCSSCGPFPQHQGPLGKNHHPYCMQELHTKCDQFKYWYERAVELQGEPAAMAVGMMRLTEERDEWRAVAQQLRLIGKGMVIAVAKDMASVVRGEPTNDLEGHLAAWNMALTGAPWEAEVFHLYRNSVVIYCAKSLDHCWELFEEEMDMTRAEEEPSDPFELIPDDEVIETVSDEPSGSSDEELRTVKNKAGKEIGAFFFEKKTAGEWAAISRPGHFSGGDY